jgi:beta-galactosidase
MFNGRLLAIVKAAAGMCPVFSAKLCEKDIPVRKIELTAIGYKVSAKLFPEDATYQDLDWRVTDAGGIDSPLAGLKVAEDGKSAVINPKGDGEAYVRCSVKNGRKHDAFISAILFSITGFGKPFLDPYSFVSGGLYNTSNVELTNGNERGVATLRDGESHVGFRDLDFGEGHVDFEKGAKAALDQGVGLFVTELWHDGRVDWPNRLQKVSAFARAALA